MAKKTDFNLSQAIRDALAKDRNCTAAECIELVQKAHPSAKFNPKTAGVTWSKLRKEMGISKRKRTTKRVAKPNVSRGHASGNGLVGALDAAAALVKAAGSLTQARQILDKLADLATPF